MVLGGLTVLDAGTGPQKLDVLNKICGGQLRMTLALTEPSATLESWGVETTATLEGDAYRISGTKLFVPDAHVADLILLAARTATGSDTAEGITLFLVPGNSPGVGVSLLGGMGSDRQCEVTLEDVNVSADAILGEVNKGWPIVQRALQRAITGNCLEMLGGADAVLDMTVEYAKQRTQFGRPVDHMDRRVGGRQTVQKRAGPVWRIIVYDKDFRIREMLENLVDYIFDIIRFVISSSKNKGFWHGIAIVRIQEKVNLGVREQIDPHTR